jgi:hypothetical protein
MSSINATGAGCRSKSHGGDAAHRMAIYDSLPHEVRDKVKIASESLCCGCIRNLLRRQGLEATLKRLDTWRRFHREKEGREVVYIWREDLKA